MRDDNSLKQKGTKSILFDRNVVATRLSCFLFYVIIVRGNIINGSRIIVVNVLGISTSCNSKVVNATSV